MSIEEENIYEKIAILCIAYNNLGIEFEHLKRVNILYNYNLKINNYCKQKKIF